MIQLININYPGNVNLFFKLVLQLADFDIFQGPEIMEALFEFKDAGTFSNHFEQYNIDG